MEESSHHQEPTPPLTLQVSPVPPPPLDTDLEFHMELLSPEPSHQGMPPELPLMEDSVPPTPQPTTNFVEGLLTY